MLLRTLIFGCAAAALSLHAGCGSDSPALLTSGGGGGDSAGTSGTAGGAPACPGPLIAPAGDCASCVASSCNAPIVAAVGAGWQSGDLSGGACGAYVTCNDACCGDQACEVGCPQQTADCTDALDAYIACEGASCASACGVTSSGAGGENVTVSCYIAADDSCSTKTVSPGGAQSFMAGCTGQGGVVGTKCPAANLTGCCVSGTRSVCSYHADAAQAKADCDASGGTWSTSP